MRTTWPVLDNLDSLAATPGCGEPQPHSPLLRQPRARWSLLYSPMGSRAPSPAPVTQTRVGDSPGHCPDPTVQRLLKGQGWRRDPGWDKRLSLGKKRFRAGVLIAGAAPTAFSQMCLARVPGTPWGHAKDVSPMRAHALRTGLVGRAGTVLVAPSSQGVGGTSRGRWVPAPQGSLAPCP